jgi:hypothetical protein
MATAGLARIRARHLLWDGQDMIVIGGFGLGAILGALAAKRRGGKGADMAQYAVAYGIAFALLGLVLTIIIARSTAP